MAEKLRLFFAVPLADDLRDVAVQLQEAVAKSAGHEARVRWVERENLHLTLKFVGDTAEEDVEKLVQIAEKVAASCSGTSLQVSGVGCFPARGAPRVIWAGVFRDSPELNELAARLDKALQDAGLAEADRNPFATHFTLGRVKDRQCGELSSAVRRLGEEPVGEMKVDHFVLMSSELTPQGPIYSEQARFELSG